MSDWPDGVDLGPIREWPGSLTPASKRRRSPFKTAGDYPAARKDVPLRETLTLLDRELAMLAAKDREVLVAIPPDQFRQDGRPRTQAKAEHPGVILSFTSRVGRLSYPCDTYETWQANLRAIALALEALRKVDRYGVTKRGEQYRGFLALEARPNVDSALESLRALIPDGWTTVAGGTPEQNRILVAQAKRATHPDLGGSADDFQRVLDAERTLREAGVL